MSYFSPPVPGVGGFPPAPTGPFSFTGLPAFSPTAPLSFMSSPGGIGSLPRAAAHFASSLTSPAPISIPGFGGAGISGLGADVGAAASNASFGSRVAGLGGTASRNFGALGGQGSSLKALAGKAALPLTAAWAVDKGIDALNPGGNNSNIEQGLQGAAYGAGIGAGIGAPLFGVGAGVGAAVGGVIGGAAGILANMFGGGGGDDKEIDPIEAINAAVNAANLAPESASRVTEAYSVYMALAERYPEDSDERKAAESQAVEAASQMVLQLMATEQQAPIDASNTLAMQVQAGQIFEPIAQDVAESGRLYAEAMARLRPSLPESYRGVADANAARELNASQKLANAYRAQAAVTPLVDRMTRYQQDNDSYAAQLFQQQMAQQGAAGGQASDVQALLAP